MDIQPLPCVGDSRLSVKNWAKYQHYKDRCPPWIKLATNTFQDYDFSRLQDASKLLALCIWTLASRSSDGSVPHDFAYIKSQCCLGQLIKEAHLSELLEKGFLEASGVLAGCKQSACLEERRDRGRGETEAEAEAQCVARLPLNDQSEYLVQPHEVEEWQRLYQAVDVVQQLRNMRGWLLSNQTRRKTRSGIPKFITTWLAKEQNHAGAHHNGNQTYPPTRSNQPLSAFERRTLNNLSATERALQREREREQAASDRAGGNPSGGSN